MRSLNKKPLILVIFILFLTAFNLNNINVNKVLEVGKALKPISVEQEVILGEQTAKILIANFGLYEKEDIVQYVNLVGQSLVYKKLREDINYKFLILDTEMVNAFACPGGIVFVTKGILKYVQTEDELAAILAHEVSHVELKHEIKEIQRGKLIKAGTEMALSDRNSTIVAQIGQHIAERLLKKGRSKSDELEADKNSLKILYATGYRLDGLLDYLNRLPDESKTGFKTLFKTHPSPKKRISKIKREMRDYDTDEYSEKIAPYVEIRNYRFSKTMLKLEDEEKDAGDTGK